MSSKPLNTFPSFINSFTETKQVSPLALIVSTKSANLLPKNIYMLLISSIETGTLPTLKRYLNEKRLIQARTMATILKFSPQIFLNVLEVLPSKVGRVRIFWEDNFRETLRCFCNFCTLCYFM